MKRKKRERKEEEDEGEQEQEEEEREKEGEEEEREEEEEETTTMHPHPPANLCQPQRSGSCYPSKKKDNRTTNHARHWAAQPQTAVPLPTGLQQQQSQTHAKEQEHMDLSTAITPAVSPAHCPSS